MQFFIGSISAPSADVENKIEANCCCHGAGSGLIMIILRFQMKEVMNTCVGVAMPVFGKMP